MKHYIPTPLFLAAALLSAPILSFVPKTALAGDNGVNGRVHQTATKPAPTEKPIKFGIPQPLIAEHKEILAELQRATQVGGKTGEAAKTVAAVHLPHILRQS